MGVVVGQSGGGGRLVQERWQVHVGVVAALSRCGSGGRSVWGDGGRSVWGWWLDSLGVEVDWCRRGGRSI